MLCEACQRPFGFSERPSDKELHAILGVAFPSNGTDVKGIQEGIANANSELERLKEEIGCTLTRAECLARRRQQIQSFLTLREALFTPILQLPAEILLEIFLTVSPNVTITPTAGFPWQLAHVCKRWKDIVLSSPVLWSSIDLAFPNKYVSEHGVMQACKVLNLCLMHSGEHPLSIRLLAHKIGNTEITRDIVETALQVRHRWRALKYVGSDFVSDNLLPPVLHLPMLRHLVLCPAHNELSILSPDLKSLDLMSLPESPVQTLTRAWPRITHLRLSFWHIDRDDLARTLLQLPELLELDILRLAQIDPSSIPIHLYRLLNLKVALGNPIIGNFTTPNLQTLVVGTNYSYTPSAGLSRSQNIINLLQRSRCSITYLILSGYLSTGDFLGIMGVTPDVEHLDFLASQRSSLWEHLTYKRYLTLLPRLHTLNLGVVDLEEFRDVVRVVKSRADPPLFLEGHNSSLAIEGRLRNLSLHLDVRKNDLHLDVPLHELIQGVGGLKVDFDGYVGYPIAIY